MEARTKALVTGAISIIAAVGGLALTVFPFDYGVVESTALAGCFVLIALYRTVLDDALSS